MKTGPASMIMTDKRNVGNASVIEREDKGSGPFVRVVSNPVEITIEPALP